MAFAGGIVGDMRIAIVLEAIDKTSAGLNAVEKKLQKIERIPTKYKRATTITKHINDEIKSVNQLVGTRKRLTTVMRDYGVEQEAMRARTLGLIGAVRMNYEAWKRANEIGIFSHKAVSLRAKFINWLRLATHGMKGFRMEYLSIMFAGMALHRTMSNLLQPASQALGITEIWSTTLLVTFLPIMRQVLDITLWFSNVLMNLPDGLKWIIGAFVVFGSILGGVLAFIGQLGLALGGIFMFLSRNTVATKLNTIETKLNAISKRQLAISAALAAAQIMNLNTALSSNIATLDTVSYTHLTLPTN